MFLSLFQFLKLEKTIKIIENKTKRRICEKKYILLNCDRQNYNNKKNKKNKNSFKQKYFVVVLIAPMILKKKIF